MASTASTAPASSSASGDERDRPTSAGTDRRSRRRRPVPGPILSFAMLSATFCGAWFVIRGPERAFVVAVAVLFALAFAWMLISVLWPANPDRTCPSCGDPGLRQRDPASTRGVACDACGFEDGASSAFLLAEAADRPLEPTVIRERVARQGSSR